MRMKVATVLSHPLRMLLIKETRRKSEGGSAGEGVRVSYFAHAPISLAGEHCCCLEVAKQTDKV